MALRRRTTGYAGRRRAGRTGHAGRPALLDLVLVTALLVGMASTAAPVISDLEEAQSSHQAISTMTGLVGTSDNPDRDDLLRDAQAYNLALAGASRSAALDNRGMGGAVGQSEDIAELASPGQEPSRPYEDQLAWRGSSTLCWIEIPKIGLREPAYHGTSDETLAQGIGHLKGTSLPVGGSSSHCVFAAHTGMARSSMFDELDRLKTGDSFVVHTLGDAYAYQVSDTEVVLPEEAEDRCRLVEGQDLCTLVTCTPYGINSHRLLVHARRVRAEADLGQESSLRMVAVTRRTRPFLLALCTGTPVAALTLFSRRRLRKNGRYLGKVRVRRGGASRLAGLLGAILVAMGLALLVGRARDRASYQELAQDAGAVVTEVPDKPEDGTSEDSAGPGDIDWEALRQVNPDLDAWVVVEGTDIDLPVMGASETRGTYYLTHNFWGEASAEGTPFLDYRCEADSAHRLAFGHHLATGGQFSSLQHAYEQEVFEKLGACRWYTPAAGRTDLQPLLALKVDQSYAPIQRCAFEGEDDLRAWLKEVARDATAARADAFEVIEHTSSVVTLVTCSSDFAFRRWRTIVVFAQVDDVPSFP